MGKKVSQFLIKNFWYLMFFGLLFRLLLAGISSWNNDIYCWYQFAADIKSGFGVYENRTFPYPPGLALIMFIIYLPLTFFSGPENWGVYSLEVDKLSAKSLLFNPIINSPFFGFYTKLPMFIAEVALLYILYLTYRQIFSETRLKTLALFFYLNPLVIFVSSIHAQLDIYVVMTMAASVLFFKKNNFLIAGLLMGFAATMKIYPAFLFLSYLYIVFYQTKRRSSRIARGAIFSLSFVLPLIVMAIYMYLTPASLVPTFARSSILGFEGSLNFGMINYIPPLVPFISKHSELLASIMQYLLISTPLIGLILVSVVVKKFPKLQPVILEFISVVVLFLVFLFSSRTNPNYLLWAMPFLLYLTVYGLVSFFNLISISLAALLFYFGIQSLAVLTFFFPMTYFGYPIESIVNQYYFLYSKSGLINSKIYADVFLISAFWFIISELSIIYRVVKPSDAIFSEYDDDSD